MKKPYQGHESFNAWAVSLWINNEESLYLTMREVFRKYGATRLGAIRLKQRVGDRTDGGDPVSLRSCLLVLQSEGTGTEYQNNGDAQ